MKCSNKDFFINFVVFVGSIIETQSISVATTLATNVKDILKNTNITHAKQLLNGSRRILIGNEVTTNRPYMVYLKLPVNNPKYQDYRKWLCGGVIIHEEYILTSAACIEDAKHFYVVSGTYRHDERDDRYNNLCIKNGAKKAVWKCIPRNYVFDGHENDNIRWMNNDIAVVKVEDEFDFYRRIRGCDFIPRPLSYNNQSQRFEEPGNEASVAGWGSTGVYSDPSPTQNLLEASVKIIGKRSCKKRWGKRYHNIIDNYMICSKDIVPEMSEICNEKYVDCTDIQYSSESGEDRRRVLNPEKLVLHSAYHNQTDGRRTGKPSGGFCENDHGGPLVYNNGGSDIVIGIISACLVKERTNQCYGPFLYTSVFKNRNLISCAIYKEVATGCDKLFRSEITHTEIEMSWLDHPDGPAKTELKAMRRKEEANVNDNATTVEPDIKARVVQTDKVETSDKVEASDKVETSDKVEASDKVKTSDKVEQHEGVIVRLLPKNQIRKPGAKTTVEISYDNDTTYKSVDVRLTTITESS